MDDIGVSHCKHFIAALTSALEINNVHWIELRCKVKEYETG